MKLKNKTREINIYLYDIVFWIGIIVIVIGITRKDGGDFFLTGIIFIVVAIVLMSIFHPARLSRKMRTKNEVRKCE